MNVIRTRTAMPDTFFRSFRDVAAREKQAVASCRAGLSYLREHIGELDGDMRTSALSWLGQQAQAGRLSQAQIDEFLGKADTDESEGGDDGYPKKKTKKKAKEPVEDEPAERDPSEPDKPVRPVDNTPKGVGRYEMAMVMDYETRVARTAAAIVRAGMVRRAEVPQRLAEAGPQPEFHGQSNPDPDYWRRVNLTAEAIIQAGRKARGI